MAERFPDPERGAFARDVQELAELLQNQAAVVKRLLGQIHSQGLGFPSQRRSLSSQPKTSALAQTHRGDSVASDLDLDQIVDAALALGAPGRIDETFPNPVESEVAKPLGEMARGNSPASSTLQPPSFSRVISPEVQDPASAAYTPGRGDVSKPHPGRPPLVQQKRAFTAMPSLAEPVSHHFLSHGDPGRSAGRSEVPRRHSRMAWAQRPTGGRRTATSEDRVNNSIFERAGIRVQPYGSPFHSNAESEGRATPVRSGARHGSTPAIQGGGEQPEDPSQGSAGARAIEASAQVEHRDSFVNIVANDEVNQVGSNPAGWRPIRAKSTVCRGASMLLEQRADQRVRSATLHQQGEEQEPFVLGREVLWQPDEFEEEDEEDAPKEGIQIGRRFRLCYTSMGTRLYSTVIKVGGLSPWIPEAPRSSQLYVLLLCLATILATAYLCFRGLLWSDGSSTHLHSEGLIALGTLLAFLLFVFASGKWGLIDASQKLSVVAQQSGFLNSWARSTSSDTLFLLFLFGGAMLLRVLSMMEMLQAFPTSAIDAAVSCIAFFIIDGVLLSQVLYLHRMSAGLTAAIDFFTERMASGESVEWGRDQWNLTTALLSNVNLKLQWGLCVLQLTLGLFVFVLVFELAIDSQPILVLIPGCLLAFGLLLGFCRISTVAAQCQRTPSMLERLPAEDDNNDSQLVRLMNRVSTSEAGIRILGVRITPALVVKSVYVVGAGTFFLILNFKIQLQSLRLANS